MIEQSIIVRTSVTCPVCSRSLSKDLEVSVQQVDQANYDIVGDLRDEGEQAVQDEFVRRGWSEVACGRCRDADVRRKP